MYKKVKYECINCKWCLQSFEPNRKDKLFCSKSCYRKYGKKVLKHSDGNRKECDKRKFPYKTHKIGFCELCGFLPKHACQLDVDHIDGNHLNNELSNLQTLCANCHRLKTAQQLGWK